MMRVWLRGLRAAWAAEKQRQSDLQACWRMEFDELVIALDKIQRDIAALDHDEELRPTT